MTTAIPRQVEQRRALGPLMRRLRATVGFILILGLRGPVDAQAGPPLTIVNDLSSSPVCALGNTVSIFAPGQQVIQPGGNSLNVSGEIVDGKVFGRGVADMKAGTMASLIAFSLLSELRDGWKGRLTFAAVADEETMGPWGANYLVDHHPKLKADAVIIGEPSTPSTVRFGEKGMVWFSLTARGQMSHSAYPHHGWNAIFEIVEALAELRGLETMAWSVPEEFLKSIDEARTVTTAMLGGGTTDVLSSVTVNAGVIEGGTKINLTADHCRADVDVRIPPGVATADILRVVGRVVRRHRGMRYDLIQRSEPNWTPPGHEFLQTVRKTATAVCGEAPYFNISAPGTDSRVFRRAGMPVAVFGPTPYFLGAANEHVTVRDFLDVIRVHALSALEFLRG